MEALTALTAQLQLLPPGVNPYPVLIAELKKASIPKPPAYFQTVLYICFVLCGLGICAAVITLFIKVRHGGLWLMKHKTTPRGTLKAPNTSFLLLLTCLVSFISTILLMYYVDDGYIGDNDTGASVAVAAVPWSTVISVTWIEAWSMATSLYLHYSSRFAYGRDRRLFSPVWITVAALVFFPLQYCTVIPIFAVAGAKMTKAFGVWIDFTKAVAPFTENWKSGSSFAITGVEPFLLPLISYVTKLEDVFDRTSTAYMSDTVFLIFSMVIYLPVSIAYGRMLKSQVQGIERSVDPTKEASKADFRSIKRAYHLLIIESLLIVCLGLLYTAECLWLIIDPASVLTSGSNLALLYTLAFLTTTISQLLLCLIFMAKTLQPILLRAKKRSGQSLSEGIVVETSVTVYIEDENREPLVLSIAEYKPGRPYVHHLETGVPVTLETDEKSVL